MNLSETKQIEEFNYSTYEHMQDTPKSSINSRYFFDYYKGVLAVNCSLIGYHI